MIGLKEFVLDKLKEGYSQNKIYIEIKHKFNYDKSRRTLNNKVKEWKKESKIEKNTDIDIIKIEASNQNLRDKNRIANKKIRQIARLTNSSKELFEDVLNRLKKEGLTIEYPHIMNINKLPVKQKQAIVQVTDLHINSNVFLNDTLGMNEFNYQIGSERLFDFAQRIKEILGDSVSDITVAFTGDLLNSDRRIDEMLSNSDCRAEALLKAVQILAGFLLDLNTYYNLTVLSVVGNESRIDQDIPIRDPLHNYDFIIHTWLATFLHKSGIKFLNMDRNYNKVLNICGVNVLFTHNYFNLTWKEAVIEYNENGIILDYMITGHKHESKISHHTAQAGSFIGADFYGVNKLKKIIKASANLYILEKISINKKPTIDVLCFDLQRTKYKGSYKYNKDVSKTEELLFF